MFFPSCWLAEPTIAELAPLRKKSAGLIVRRQSLQKICGGVYSRVRETVSFGAEFSSM
jgi:hypothetical protein